MFYTICTPHRLFSFFVESDFTSRLATNSFVLMWFSVSEIFISRRRDLWICRSCIWICLIIIFLLLPTVVEITPNVAQFRSDLILFGSSNSLTAAGLVLPQHFDRFKTSHWGIGSSPCSLRGDVTRKRDYVLCKFSSMHTYYARGSWNSIAYCYQDSHKLGGVREVDIRPAACDQGL